MYRQFRRYGKIHDIVVPPFSKGENIFSFGLFCEFFILFYYKIILSSLNYSSIIIVIIINIFWQSSELYNAGFRSAQQSPDAVLLPDGGSDSGAELPAQGELADGDGDAGRVRHDAPHGLDQGAVRQAPQDHVPPRWSPGYRTHCGPLRSSPNLVYVARLVLDLICTVNNTPFFLF